MADANEFCSLAIDPDGNINLAIEVWGLWWALPEETREYIIRDVAYWHIIEESLNYELGKSLSTPGFNSSIHKLREMIVTNPEFVNDITVSFIKQLLEETAKAEQDKRKAEQAFWKLYHDTYHSGDRDMRVTFPNDIGREDKYLRVSTKEVRQEIMDHFRELLKKERKEQEND